MSNRIVFSFFLLQKIFLGQISPTCHEQIMIDRAVLLSDELHKIENLPEK